MCHPCYIRFMHRRSWKEFKGVAARIVKDRIRAGIDPTRAEIKFDNATFRKMGEPQAMHLLYERSTRTIGLRPAHPDSVNAVLVRVRHDRCSRVVRSTAFLREHGIELETPVRIPYPALEGNVLTLDLKTAVACGQRVRKIKPKVN